VLAAKIIRYASKDRKGEADGRCDDTATRSNQGASSQQLLVVLLSSYCACEAVRHLMNRNTYLKVTAALFLVMAIVHLLRIILGWHVEIGGLSIPFWVSWLAVPVAGALAYLGFTQKR
jgi:hypothetical protein